MTKYFDFQGSITRERFWATMLFSWGIFIIATLLFLGLASVDSPIIGLAGLITLFGLAWVQLAAGAKRARDAGCSPWWAAAMCVPYVAIVVIIVLGFMPSTNAKAGE
jgi:uncharacterized membrane protein YhaH (DUF805 family)